MKYDPFAPGPHAVRIDAFEAHDTARDRVFPVRLWQPEAAGSHRLILFSHHSGGSRLTSTFLCTHLASHGYAVAALDHSEVVAPELAGRADQSPAERAALVEAVVASRVPDLQFLIDHLGADEVGLVGHSFGGWTVLATPEVDTRVRAVVALAPAGRRQPRPGLLPVTLTFEWHRDVPTLYLAGEYDVPCPPSDVHELFERTPGTKNRMFVLGGADHQHFLDDVETMHEAVRGMEFPEEAAWIPTAMRPMTDLCSGADAHLFTRGLTLAHLDATLRSSGTAAEFLDEDAVAALVDRDVEATAVGRW